MPRADLPAASAAILSLLADHRPADASEADSLTRIRGLVTDTRHSHTDPFDRHHFTPGHLTASAIVLAPARDRAVLIHHAKLGLWLQPGGHFEPEEVDPLVAATREALEETGLVALPGPLLDVDVHTIPARKQDPTHAHFDLRFLLTAESDDAHAGDGATDYRWITPDQIETLDLDPGLRRALRKVWPA